MLEKQAAIQTWKYTQILYVQEMTKCLYVCPEAH
jgi:hypothetical protein